MSVGKLQVNLIHLDDKDVNGGDGDVGDDDDDVGDDDEERTMSHLGERAISILFDRQPRMKRAEESSENKTHLTQD